MVLTGCIVCRDNIFFEKKYCLQAFEWQIVSNIIAIKMKYFVPKRLQRIKKVVPLCPGKSYTTSSL